MYTFQGISRQFLTFQVYQYNTSILLHYQIIIILAKTMHTLSFFSFGCFTQIITYNNLVDLTQLYLQPIEWQMRAVYLISFPITQHDQHILLYILQGQSLKFCCDHAKEKDLIHLYVFRIILSHFNPQQPYTFIQYFYAKIFE